MKMIQAPKNNNAKVGLAMEVVAFGDCGMFTSTLDEVLLVLIGGGKAGAAAGAAAGVAPGAAAGGAAGLAGGGSRGLGVPAVGGWCRGGGGEAGGGVTLKLREGGEMTGDGGAFVGGLAGPCGGCAGGGVTSVVELNPEHWFELIGWPMTDPYSVVLTDPDGQPLTAAKLSQQNGADGFNSGPA